jgi:excisionase family DNA binding protein
MPKTISGTEYFSASEAAQMVGVHRLTLLRWIKEGKVPDVSRDRNGWRIFSAEVISQILKYAHTVGEEPNPFQLRLFSQPVKQYEIKEEPLAAVAEESFTKES